MYIRLPLKHSNGTILARTHATQIHTSGNNKIINLNIAVNGWIYMEVRKGIPGLKQDG